jgi:hypothetical protein
MFPRRRTDQVYATLQQVQRRITEQGGQPGSVATPAGMAPPAPRVGNPTPGPLPALAGAARLADQPPPAPPLLPPGVGAHQRYSIALSGTLASLLVVCWLASLAAAILITAQVMRPGAGTTAPTVRDAPMAAIEATRAERWKLVVLSEPRSTPEARSRLALVRDQYNGVARASAARGWKPLFTIEEGVNGALALVYGAPGVDRAQPEMQDLFRTLSNSQPGAAWVAVP